jgi:hypothetical protein
LQFIIVEGIWLWLRQKSKSDGYNHLKKNNLTIDWIWNVYGIGVLFYFGTAVTLITTNIPKYTIGRYVTWVGNHSVLLFFFPFFFFFPSSAA